jgi:molybdate transport system substrate-binding protein
VSKELRRIILITLICLAVMAAALALAGPSHGAAPQAKLLVHAGAGIRPALDEAAAAFEKQTGIKVEYNYKGSGCLLPDVLLTGQGDVYIPGEEYYVRQAVARKLVDKSYRIVATMTTVIIARPGNPKHLRTLADLAKPGVRLGLGDPKVVACGQAAKNAFTKAKLWAGAEKNLVMTGQNVSELSNAVRLGNLDAAVVWDATASMYSTRDLAKIAIAPRYSVTYRVPVGVVTKSRQMAMAKRYMDFLAGPEGRRIFLKHGFGLPAAPPAKGKAQGKA